MAVVTLIDVGRIVFSRWIAVLVTTVCTACVFVLSTFLITPDYRAQVTLMAARDATPSWAGNLARITSSSVSRGAGRFKPTSPKAVAVGMLLSHAVTVDYIREHNLLPVLFADRWDDGTGSWRRNDGWPAPTLDDGVRFFERRVRTVSEDQLTGLITLQIDWPDPKLAAQWANELVSLTNARLRDLAIVRADSNIAYLQKRLHDTELTPLSAAVADSLGAELAMRTVLGGTNEYAFRILDPAVVPHERAFPRRLEFAAIGFLLGLMGSAYYAMVRHEARVGAQP